ncbi:DNA glycosylase [Blastocladiella britannica]|nr:DNA glycosylase [Blastocladiella britannica]
MRSRAVEADDLSDIEDLESHQFTDHEVETVRAAMLAWFDANRRDLPWRRYGPPAVAASQPTPSADADVQPVPDAVSPGQRAYEVWVSEIMCQQTQVATVIPYYQRWMAKWPTVFDLAKATDEEVNQQWAGLGYYSRGRRLVEAARTLAEKYNGVLPDTPERLEKEIPGIGKYTAGAIAACAYGVVTPQVDGNVVRVLSRMRTLGGDPKAKKSIEAHWDLARSLVDPLRPGAFNESLMELGATVCTPTSPSCATCPVQVKCWAASGNTRRLGSCRCDICSTWTMEADGADQVGPSAYPRKPAKKAPREETVHVVVIRDTSSSPTRVLLIQRPASGLLAGLWEFLNAPTVDELQEALVHLAGEDSAKHTFEQPPLGSIVHLFSHIRMTMVVYTLDIADPAAAARAAQVSATTIGRRAVQWMADDELAGGAIPTGAKKVWKLATNGPAPLRSRKRAASSKESDDSDDTLTEPPAVAPPKRSRSARVAERTKVRPSLYCILLKSDIPLLNN